MQSRAARRDESPAAVLSAYAGPRIRRVDGCQGTCHPTSALRKRRFDLLLESHAMGAPGKLGDVADLNQLNTFCSMLGALSPNSVVFGAKAIGMLVRPLRVSAIAHVCHGEAASRKYRQTMPDSGRASGVQLATKAWSRADCYAASDE